METVRIFACTIKRYKRLKIDGYETLHIGSALTEENFGDGYIADFNGINISKKQPYYCELSGLYWIWKNVNDAEIVGLCHYRRSFVVNKYTFFKPHIVNKEDAITILNEYDIIVPKKLHKNINNGWTIESSFKNDWYINLLLDVVSDLESQYVEALRSVFNADKMSFQNLIITKKYTINNYCAWLFKILFEFENRLIAISKLESRNVGYAAEWLFNAWLIVNPDSLKIRYMDVLKIDEKRGAVFYLKVILAKLGILDILINLKNKRKMKREGIEILK